MFELANLIRAWPKLSVDVRRAICRHSLPETYNREPVGGGRNAPKSDSVDYETWRH